MLIAFVVAQQKGFRHTWIYVALPAQMLFPAYYYMELPMIPEANFWNFTFCVTFAALLLSEDRKLYKLHWVDLVVIFYIMWTVYSEFENKNWKDAQKVFANQIMGVWIPYFFGRVIMMSNSLLVSTWTMIGLLGAVIGFLSLYEARFGMNPFDKWLRNMWPWYVGWDRALYRFGLRRVQGPFTHAICFGFWYSMTIPILLWMRDRKLLKGWVAGVGIPLGNVAGMLLSGSRGPWMGFAIAFGIMRIGWVKQRALAAGCVLFTLVVGTAAGYQSFMEYVSIDRATAQTEAQENAAYRKELLDNYLEVLATRPNIGFGRNRIPVINGQWSIDNQYLFLALIHGYPAAYAFGLSMLLPIFLLLGRLARSDPDNDLGRLGWAVMGAIAGSIFTQLTVFAGSQTEQLLCTLEGMGISILIRLKAEALVEAEAEKEAKRARRAAARPRLAA